MNIQDLEQTYSEYEDEIREKLQEFKQLRNSSEKRIFKELVFVILTSQSDAKECWNACLKLDEMELIEKGSKKEIEQVLTQFQLQYEKRKSEYIVKNRNMFSQPSLTDPTKDLKIKQRINPDKLEKTREEFVEEIIGINWKGSSHFLRNIGYGNGFAIISTHICKALNELGYKDDARPPKSKENYLKLEEKVQKISEITDIDIKALDLVIWAERHDEVFK